MEKNYSRRELEEKSLFQLKQIAKNRGINTAGNLQQLIDRILENQKLGKTYFGLLPPELRKEIENIRIINKD